MSNPTSNFNWQMPTNTDLVTDLPADFAVFGQAVDTSMADLKGGTTGQILSKATNTDMDFTWITNDVGDITAVTATSPLTGGGTSGAITVGIQDATTSVKGSVQLSDSTSTTSSVLAATPTAVKSAYDLAAAAVPSSTNFFAGKNKFINGDFSVWQRGTSFTLTTATETYCADRYSFAAYGTSTAATVTRQTFTPGTAPVAGYEGQYFARLTNFATATAWQIRQRIENVQTFAGQTVTFSFWAKAGTAISSAVTVQSIQNFGSGGSTAVTTNFTSVGSITTGWARYTYTLAIPAVTGKTIGTSSYLDITIFQNASLTNSNAIDTWGWQIEAASTASNFATATGTVQGELAACQRYYYRAGGDAPFQRYSTGLASSTTVSIQDAILPVTMRAVPSLLEYSTLAVYDGVTLTAVTSAAINVWSRNVATINATVASGLTQYRPYELIANNSSSSYLGFSAEL